MMCGFKDTFTKTKQHTTEPLKAELQGVLWHVGEML
jgi:hypothetical protein